jgi:inhibitor of cysteine peptidase
MKPASLKLTGIMIAFVIIVVSFVYAINVKPIVTGEHSFATSAGLKQFNSYSELTEFLMSSKSQPNWNLFNGLRFQEDASGISASISDSGGKTVDYSQTNIQVAGVDEPDIVKTDGVYLYIVTGNKVIIVKATPAENATIEGEVSINENFTISNIFICDNKLVIFAENYDYPIYITEKDLYSELPRWYYSPDTYVKIFDITDLSDSEVVKDIVIPGRFTGARLIGDYVYIVTNQYSYDFVYLEEDELIIPRISVNSNIIDIPLKDILYIDTYEQGSSVTNIVSINVKDDSDDVTIKVFLLGNTEILYVSKDNIYVVYSSNFYDYDLLQKTVEEVMYPILPENLKAEIEIVKTLSLTDYQKQTVIGWILENYTNSMEESLKQELALDISKIIEKTTIHRISISNGNIEYAAKGEIQGSVNNQFSLSEYDGYLRVSSTLQGQMFGYFLSNAPSQNNIYVLDMNLRVVGKLEGLAEGERIFATRFIEDKCYLVTFRQIDPFFVIDLSDPRYPTLLGELKIPGYSTYLHPYDDNHIIGIGMEESAVKISFFDVTDLSNPVEISKYEITGDDYWWGSSTALYEHKAFLFDEEKNLLVIPAGSYSKESAYVFDITIEDGVQLKGIIVHEAETEEKTEEDYNYWYYDYGYSIKRCLYIDNVLYTISEKMVKMNSLEDLFEINSLNIA